MDGVDLPHPFVEEVVALGHGRELVIGRPRDALTDEFLDDDVLDCEEKWPYWAELWPSGVALAREVAGRHLRGARVLELGCGLGTVSLAAALAGGRVLATDWANEALTLTRGNAERNGLEVELQRVSWARPELIVDRAPWDLVLASDVLYERVNIPLLLGLLPRLGDEVWLADPGRAPLAEFLERAAADWEIEDGDPVRRLRRRRTVGG